MGVGDGLPHIIWMNNFMRAQGYKLSDVEMHQDNKSAPILKTQGKAASNRRTRHLDICFFFVKDKVEKKEIMIKYEPTEAMIVDYMTKPLQGKMFQRFWDAIMETEYSKRDTGDRSKGTDKRLGNAIHLSQGKVNTFPAYKYPCLGHIYEYDQMNQGEEVGKSV